VVYDDRARLFARAWKERGRRGLADEAAGLIAEVVARPAADALVPVPGDPERALERGDVPPRGLAAALSGVWGISVGELLVRKHSLRRQRGLSLEERRRNVRSSVLPRGQPPPAVCVVDDVYASGATADACARALRGAGARRVEVVTFARALRID